MSRAHFVDRLAGAAKDCPLVTVIRGTAPCREGGRTRAPREARGFRGAVFSKFSDEIIGRLSDQIERDSCPKLLHLIAAVMPVDPSDDRFLDAAADYLRMDKVTLVTAIAHLEEMEVVYREGRVIRITQDVLADHILHDACLTTQGRKTGSRRRSSVSSGEFVPPNY